MIKQVTETKFLGVLIHQHLSWNHILILSQKFKILVDFKILAIQHPAFKILDDFKGLALQNPECKILADFKILNIQNPPFKILADFNILVSKILTS